MRYSDSTSRVDLGRQVDGILNVVTELEGKGSVDPSLKNYVLSSAILFLHAKIENYVSDLIKSICQNICRENAGVADIPPALLGWVFLGDGNLNPSLRFVAFRDEYDYIATTGTYLSSTLLDQENPYLQIDKFKNIDDRAYPSVRNLRKTFKRIGIDDLFDRLNRKLNMDAERAVKSFNDLRGSLAHIGISGELDFEDVKEKALFSKQLVKAIDEITFQHLENTCPASYWS